MTKEKLNPAALKPYLLNGWRLLPLHRPFATSTDKKGRVRKDGKRPIHAVWAAKTYDSKKVVERYAGKHNIGVQLRDEDLVLDIDPRNGGASGWAKLCKRLRLDPSEWPRVITGSGGDHYYLKKPAGVKVVDTLEDYPGVEFKSKGRQVVAAGSLHPDTGKLYEWDEFGGNMIAPPKCPSALLEAITRPEAPDNDGTGGEHSPAEIAEFLEALDPVEFRAHDKWLELMMACHHASGGEARQEFIEWSAGDDSYSGMEEINGRRWDSLHTDKPGERVVGKATLYKALKDAGHGRLIPRRDPGADFEDDTDGELPASAKAAKTGKPKDKPKKISKPEPSEPSESESEEDEEAAKRREEARLETLSLMERMNENCCAVLEGSKFRVFVRKFDHEFQRPFWATPSRQDFENAFANRRIERGNSTVSAGKAWIEYGSRRTAEGVIFDPTGTPPGYLNLWEGWGVEPEGTDEDWSRIQEMIFEVICNGDDKKYEYLINWCAKMAQSPATPGQVAIAVRGAKGTGKGTLGRLLVKLAGMHGMQIASSQHITGRFNSHLRNVIMLFADEAIRPGDRSAENTLKSLITEQHVLFEAKGRDATMALNRLHIYMATNDEWFVSASAEERRYMVMEANSKWLGKVDKWNALNNQIDFGGDSAFLKHLLEHKIPHRWHPQAAIPKTAELIDQKLRSLDPIPRWWYSVLYEGHAPCEPLEPEADWAEEPIRIFKSDFREAMNDWCRAAGITKGGMGRNLDHFVLASLEKYAPGIGRKLFAAVPAERSADAELLGKNNEGRAQIIELPPLPKCREIFSSVMGGIVDFPVDEFVSDDPGF